MSLADNLERLAKWAAAQPGNATIGLHALEAKREIERLQKALEAIRNSSDDLVAVGYAVAALKGDEV